MKNKKNLMTGSAVCGVILALAVSVRAQGPGQRQPARIAVQHPAAPVPIQIWNHRPGSSARPFRLPAGLAQAVVAALGSQDSSDCGQFVQRQELLATDGAANDEFGTSVALSNDGHTALIGAWMKNNELGAAYIFTEHDHTWTEQQELTAPDQLAYGEFGYAVALSGDGHSAVIGAPHGSTPGNGAVYVFTDHDHSWTAQQKLIASDASFDDEFGTSVALDKRGRMALIGAIGGNASSGTGAAYIFIEHGNTWSQEQEVIGSNSSPGDQFGSSVALSNDAHTALISAYARNNLEGAAYIFTEDDKGWTERQELTEADGAANDNFGLTVALDNDGHIALIGAPGRNGYEGAAYIFTEQDNTWIQQQELTDPDGAAWDLFGFSLALDSDGHTALIGMPGKNNSQGAAYFYIELHNTWTLQQTLTALGGSANDGFGVSVAITKNGDTALIGADGYNAFTGAAYIFSERHCVPVTASAATSPK